MDESKTSVSVTEPDWKLSNPEDGVEFITEPEYYGIIPEPEPAHKFMPDWYKQLPLEVDESEEASPFRNSTVRKCIPFLEAMKQGYILKTPCDISITIEKDGKFNYRWQLDGEVMSHFENARLGDAFPGDGPILKFHSMWKMRVPDGYSMLQTPLMNRRDQNLFSPFCGFLDIDSYLKTMNSVVEWTGGDYNGVIEKGTPIMQIIPIKRDSLLTEAVTRKMIDEEMHEVEMQDQQLKSKRSAYKKEMWNPVDATRVTSESDE